MEESQLETIIIDECNNENTISKEVVIEDTKKEEVNNMEIEPHKKVGITRNKVRVKMLGEGTYGRVSRAIYNDISSAVKINMYQKSMGWPGGIVNLIEYDILKRFSNHPLFLKFYDACTTGSAFIHEVNRKTIKSEDVDDLFDRSDQRYDNIHFVIELGKCSLDDLAYENNLHIDDLAKIMADIILGLEYMHMNNVLHRDLKAGNVIIFDDDNGEYKAKICDFGMSKYISSGDENANNVATYTSRSPEIVLDEKYGPPLDMWTAGCILYEILFDNVIIDLPPSYTPKKDDDGKVMKDEDGQVIKEKVYKFNKRKALLDIYKYSNHNISLENFNRILKNNKMKPVKVIQRENIETMVNNKLNDEFFADEYYTRTTLTELLNGLLTFGQNDRMTASAALELTFFQEPSLKQYIQEVRQWNLPIDMVARPLHIYHCKERNIIYEKIKAKKYLPGNYSSEERMDIHALVMFDRALRASSKDPEYIDDIEKNYENYFTVCSGLSRKLFNEGEKASKSYIEKIKKMNKNWFLDMEETMILDVLEYPYELTPYEIAINKGLKPKGDLFIAIVDKMMLSEDVMDMYGIVEKAETMKPKKIIGGSKIAAKKGRIPRNRK